jgi:integrase
MANDHHTLLDGRVHVYQRKNSRFWQCAIYLGGRNHRISTRQDRLAPALTVAREWALDMIAQDRLGARQLRLNEAVAKLPQPPAIAAGAKTFKDAAETFIAEYRVLTAGERNAEYVEGKARHLKLRLIPFFGKRPLNEVTAGLIQQYRISRLEKAGDKRPSRSTLHQEMVTLRQVLKSANRQGWIAAVPDMSAPYKSSGKIARRAWFSPEEYERLRAATEERARNPKRDRWRGECELFHDFVEFMANTGLRPDEAQRLEFRDVKVVLDESTQKRILEIDVRGKRGVGFCKSTPDAVPPFERLLKRRGAPQPTNLVFGKIQRQLMNAVLEELGLKEDRDGNPRTAYSLRHTYICLRLLEGADIYQVAKNCRTSVEMIERFYASHIKTRLNAAALNGRRG